MRLPEQVAEYLRRRFDSDYPKWARNEGTWPMRVPLRPPSPAQRSEDPVACHAWAEQWNGFTGPGRVDYSDTRFPTGTHAMPKTLVLQSPHDVADVHPDTRETWRRCGHRLTTLQREFPDATFTGIIRRITELDEHTYQRLRTAVTWLRANPTSGMLLRQLPIEGIDTKWLSQHARLVLALLGKPDAPDTNTAETRSQRRHLHERLGLRRPPDLVQVTVLDPGIRSQFAGMRHFAASVDDLNQWPQEPDTVVILENKETGYAIPDDHADVVVLHGHGFHVSHLARINWVRHSRKIVYWGDIDAPGLQFVNDLRIHGLSVNTVLMDITTLERFRHLSVNGSLPQRTTLPQLTVIERKLHEHLAEHAARHGTGLLLEQERIPWDYAYPELLASVSLQRP
ncbi:hypothetical protein SAMN04487820_105195 [Actinopolyspora mzabensis]|uniref:Wadjet protein JetD C-terminal domain-containing protein n=1 Tax=Actinopolyspora mzabensis TaxID=995066 RepID=A0A1G8ZXP6_ACTMZ|nr:Wadjet anti-phage system protein JetD domain-containing protein [Actinopolyspora mzabensis]SDK19823.1 hypothetical protein SAMN04487820_105195 [Actinopolyspora mzabensis]